MSPRGSVGKSEPPSIEARQAITLLRRQLERLAPLIAVDRNDPRVEAWKNSTEEILHAAFGRPNGEAHRNTDQLLHVQSGEPFQVGMDDLAMQHHYVLRQRKRAALLESFIEQLEDLTSTVPHRSGDEYQWHPEIERISGKAYRDGNYRSAVLDAFVFVIETVRNTANVGLDGDKLMNRAFGADGEAKPVFQFNDLADDFQKAEQRGILFLFRGIVGIRTSKAHLSAVTADRTRAFEYLALASLLLRLLEASHKNDLQSVKV